MLRGRAPTGPPPAPRSAVRPENSRRSVLTASWEGGLGPVTIDSLAANRAASLCLAMDLVLTPPVPAADPELRTRPPAVPEAAEVRRKAVAVRRVGDARGPGRPGATVVEHPRDVSGPAGAMTPALRRIEPDGTGMWPTRAPVTMAVLSSRRPRAVPDTPRRRRRKERIVDADGVSARLGIRDAAGTRDACCATCVAAAAPGTSRNPTTPQSCRDSREHQETGEWV